MLKVLELSRGELVEQGGNVLLFGLPERRLRWSNDNDGGVLGGVGRAT